MASKSSDDTRMVMLPDFADRAEARNEGTRCLLPKAGRSALDLRARLDLRAIFNGCHLDLARCLQDESRPGAMFFVLGEDGIQGALWLAATDQMRAGSVGRHGCADLFLPGDPELSLRHCLVMARRLGEALRIHVVDLSSSAGLRLEDDQPVGALDADGHFFLRVPGAVLACFPTGQELPWNPDSVPAWSTLAPRKVVKQLGRAERTGSPIQFARELLGGDREGSHITRRPAPIVEAPLRGRLLVSGEVPAGRLELESDSGREVVEVGLSALDRGVVLGRYDRCVGSRALSDDTVSRVHALLVRRDERLYLADAGSTCGTWLGEEEVVCAQVARGAEYRLAGATLVWNPLD